MLVVSEGVRVRFRRAGGCRWMHGVVRRIRERGIADVLGADGKIRSLRVERLEDQR